MDVQLRLHILLCGVEKVAELSLAMPLLGLADDVAGTSVERGEKAGGAMTLVVVGAPLDLSWSHRQQRRGAI